MKIATLIFSIYLFTLASCSTNKSTEITPATSSKTEVNAEILKSFMVDIQGMTCEVGCARIIQSKVSKLDGVHFSKVDFENKKGYFTFKSNTLKKEEILKTITSIGDGSMYSVSLVTDLDSILSK